MGNNITTRAGIEPAKEAMPFSITTKMAEKFLQEKIDRVIKKANESGSHYEPVDIRLITVKMSKKFLPFMVILPVEALANSESKTQKDELDIFNGDQEDRQVRIKKPLFDVLSMYAYNKKDEESFFSNVWRQALGVTLRDAHTLKSNRTPKVQSLNKGKVKKVIFFIDPLRVFHDMLTDVANPNERFFIGNIDAHKMDNTNFKYNMERRQNSKKTKEEISFEQLILSDMGYNGRD